MSFVSHPTFNEPSPDAVVWRYLDFTKYVDLLDTSTLWFTKPRLLSDRWELAYSKANLARWLDRLDPNPAVRNVAISNYNADLEAMFVNCWHVGKDESAAMWRLYLQSTEGVAIRTTWKKLTASVGAEDDRDPVTGGLVRYIDFELDETDDGFNIYFPTTTKRRSFDYEHEARLVYWWRPLDGRGEMVPAGPDLEVWKMEVPSLTGLDVAFDLNSIDAVVVCPGSADWFKRLVRKVTSNYGLEVIPQDSAMDNEPSRLA